jgi:hypothetical protein
MAKRFVAGMLGSFVLLLGATAMAQEGPSNAGGAPQGAPPTAGARIEIEKDAPPKVELQKDKDAYFAALEKCEPLQNTADKQQCVDTVRRQYGQM